ncbi:methyltransferase domain-containing protein [Lujinxingia sediminis]|uniref:Methyltransferase domain-containing protein n=1 Tax=Lujinxingia sediminis TaxID=2480984 RepID=A0ABY0CVZ7_9DELT|nr:methyltransferase domain-containing protein [Lujinxingia sediminis]RVU48032.1 methyltransferase domain-containing protein [Lujinxingia sediminis]
MTSYLSRLCPGALTLLLTGALACSGPSTMEKAEASVVDDSAGALVADNDELAVEDGATEEPAVTEHHKHHEHHSHEHAHPSQGHHDHAFKNPEDYVDRWNSPERDLWQRPAAVVEAMQIEPGMSVADIGAGTGYFIPHLVGQVGPEGLVYAVDMEDAMLRYIDDEARARGWVNVETVQARADASGLEPGSVDRILSVNTWHHIPEREAYARHLTSRLRPGGSVWIVDYDKDSPQGPPAQHRMTPEQIIAELEAGGFEAELHELTLERQFLVVGRLPR